MEKEMRTLHVEGVATHDGPESCVDVRKDGSVGLPLFDGHPPSGG